ncbi:uncharacterized protein BDW47DRAFT_39622 [Aspergillus candidus]|uniref:Uncharacterized protein n=1 Tax=Aspergillus candidus TaxID=41067 RepID=A0A2I2F8X1_ASPCN|nr:hypothetical protein BDW47DRAFT_39622 [Aspergillus candidus]PLB37084.1 hypothetical protein BDW47DRAFT_39622 [Aspergillus candidus]
MPWQGLGTDKDREDEQLMVRWENRVRGARAVADWPVGGVYCSGRNEPHPILFSLFFLLFLFFSPSIYVSLLFLYRTHFINPSSSCLFSIAGSFFHPQSSFPRFLDRV